MDNPLRPNYSPDPAEIAQLIEMFPHMDHEIVQFVLVEVKGEVGNAIEKLLEMSADSSLRKDKSESNDLAMIACSLLSEDDSSSSSKHRGSVSTASNSVDNDFADVSSIDDLSETGSNCVENVDRNDTGAESVRIVDKRLPSVKNDNIAVENLKQSKGPTKRQKESSFMKRKYRKPVDNMSSSDENSLEKTSQTVVPPSKDISTAVLGNSSQKVARTSKTNKSTAVLENFSTVDNASQGVNAPDFFRDNGGGVSGESSLTGWDDYFFQNSLGFTSSLNSFLEPTAELSAFDFPTNVNGNTDKGLGKSSIQDSFAVSDDIEEKKVGAVNKILETGPSLSELDKPISFQIKSSSKLCQNEAVKKELNSSHKKDKVKSSALKTKQSRIKNKTEAGVNDLDVGGRPVFNFGDGTGDNSQSQVSSLPNKSQTEKIVNQNPDKRTKADADKENQALAEFYNSPSDVQKFDKEKVRVEQKAKPTYVKSKHFPGALNAANDLDVNFPEKVDELVLGKDNSSRKKIRKKQSSVDTDDVDFDKCQNKIPDFNPNNPVNSIDKKCIVSENSNKKGKFIEKNENDIPGFNPDQKPTNALDKKCIKSENSIKNGKSNSVVESASSVKSKLSVNASEFVPTWMTFQTNGLQQNCFPSNPNPFIENNQIFHNSENSSWPEWRPDNGFHRKDHLRKQAFFDVRKKAKEGLFPKHYEDSVKSFQNFDVPTKSKSFVVPKLNNTWKQGQNGRSSTYQPVPDTACNKLHFHGIKTPLGMARRYANDKQPVMFILRGLPGSGKSYLAKQILAQNNKSDDTAEGVILSTDDFFENSGVYRYDRSRVDEAHLWNKQRAINCVGDGLSPVIIDNTNTMMWELLPYAVLAIEHGYDLQIVEPDTAWQFKVQELTKKNIHGVTRDHIKRMKDRYENLNTDTVLLAATRYLENKRSKVKPQPLSEHFSDSDLNKAQPKCESVAARKPSATQTDTPSCELLGENDTKTLEELINEESSKKLVAKTSSPPSDTWGDDDVWNPKTSDLPGNDGSRVDLTEKGKPSEYSWGWDEPKSDWSTGKDSGSGETGSDWLCGKNAGPTMTGSGQAELSNVGACLDNSAAKDQRQKPSRRRMRNISSGNDGKISVSSSDGKEFTGKESNDEAAVSENKDLDKIHVKMEDDCKQDEEVKEACVFKDQRNNEAPIAKVDELNDYCKTKDEDNIAYIAVNEDDKPNEKSTSKIQHTGSCISPLPPDAKLSQSVAEDQSILVEDSNDQRKAFDNRPTLSEDNNNSVKPVSDRNCNLQNCLDVLTEQTMKVIRPFHEIPKEIHENSPYININIKSSISNNTALNFNTEHRTIISCGDLRNSLKTAILGIITKKEIKCENFGKEWATSLIVPPSSNTESSRDHKFDKRKENMCASLSGSGYQERRENTQTSENLRSQALTNPLTLDISPDGELKPFNVDTRNISPLNPFAALLVNKSPSPSAASSTTSLVGDSGTSSSPLRATAAAEVTGENISASVKIADPSSCVESTTGSSQPFSSNVKDANTEPLSISVSENSVCSNVESEKSEILNDTPDSGKTLNQTEGCQNETCLSDVDDCEKNEKCPEIEVSSTLSTDLSTKEDNPVTRPLIEEADSKSLVTKSLVTYSDSESDGGETDLTETQIVDDTSAVDCYEQPTNILPNVLTEDVNCQDSVLQSNKCKMENNVNKESHETSLTNELTNKIDRKLSSTSVTHSESPSCGSPCATSDSSTPGSPKKKKTRIRKGRRVPAFLDESTKQQSQSLNWNTFEHQIPKQESNIPELNISPVKSTKTLSSSNSSQCEAYYFSLVYKLNSESFSGLTTSDVPSNDYRVVSSKLQPLDLEVTAGSVVARKDGTSDKSTETDEVIEQDSVDLDTLQSCFPEYSRRQLQDTLTICHHDMEWVTGHLLDSSPVGSQKSEEDDNMAVDKGKMVAEWIEETSSQGKKVETLASLCSRAVKLQTNIDADDLEMKVIQAGQSRLQKIENHSLMRLVSMSSDRPSLTDIQGEFSLDNFSGTVTQDECWEWIPPQSPPASGGESVKLERYLDTNFTERSNDLSLKKPENKVAHFITGNLEESTGRLLRKSTLTPLRLPSEKKKLSSKIQASVMSPTAKSLSPLEEFLQNSAKAKSPRKVEKRINQVSVPAEFVTALESMFGPLERASEQEDIILDETVARKIYNCLKLQTNKKKVRGKTQAATLTTEEEKDDGAVSSVVRQDQERSGVLTNEQQLQADEALARSLQDEALAQSLQEEDNQKPGTASGTVQGWTNEKPAWMTTYEEESAQRLHSVSRTLHQLRGTKGKKLKPQKFKTKSNASTSNEFASTVWYDSNRGRKPENFTSIMEEEQQIEQRLQEKYSQMQAMDKSMLLSTKLKRKELGHMYPTIPPDFINEVFFQNNCSKEATVTALAEIGVKASPMLREQEEAVIDRMIWESKTSQSTPQHAPEDDWIEDIGGTLTYDELRSEAQLYRSLARECQDNALRYQSDGMAAAAFFYRQQVKKYKDEELAANQRAAEVLFEKRNEQLHKESLLDLHCYHLEEAKLAVDRAIILKEEENDRCGGKKNKHLYVITGRGIHSKGGLARLRPGVISHLNHRGIRFDEVNDGMMKIYLGQRV